jgi:hypothetical protein
VDALHEGGGDAAFAFDATVPNDPPTLAIVHNAAALAPLLPFVRCDSQAIVKASRSR